MFSRAKLVPRRVRTEARFRGVDPWNGDAPAELSIETYYYVPEHVRDVPAPCPWGETTVHAIRSGVDGVERFLPDALGHLWRTGRVSAEALPGLLREMEPDLGPADFQPVLGAPPGRRMTVLPTLLLAAVVGVLLTWPRGGEGRISGLAIACGAAAAACLLGTLLTLPAYLRLRGRRSRQMDRALQRLKRSLEGRPGERPRLIA
jgi:hypothetical protein